MADEDSSRHCAHCGELFRLKTNKTTGLPSTRPRVYCGRVCLVLSARLRHKGKPRPYRKRPSRRVEGFCPGCGLHFLRERQGGIGGREDAGKYCSQACYQDARSRVSSERYALRAIATNWQWRPNKAVALEIESLRRIAKRPVVQRLTRRPCSGGCGSMLAGYMEYSRTCKDCKGEKRRDCARRFRKTAEGKAQRRVEKARRRAICRGAEADRIDPIKVFDRDGWRCHLCGCLTPPKLRGTYEPNAPEMDHVIALALGGTHTWDNVRCSCRKCNGDKGPKAFGQLAIPFAA